MSVDEQETLSPYYLIIQRVANGYILCPNNEEEWVIEDDEVDELKSHEAMLWKVIDHFCFYGSKHDRERISIIRKKNK